MFDKNEMKLISFEKAKKEMMNGVQVFMVQMNGTLTEVTGDTAWQAFFVHNLTGGSYAVYKKKIEFGFKEFRKDFHVGKNIFTVEHTKEGGEEAWRFATCKEEE